MCTKCRVANAGLVEVLKGGRSKCKWLQWQRLQDSDSEDIEILPGNFVVWMQVAEVAAKPSRVVGFGSIIGLHYNSGDLR